MDGVNMSDSISINSSNDPKRNRLGNNVIPIHYELFFNTNFKTFEYSGKEEIKAEIKKSTKEIVLNANGIRFLNAKIVSKGITQECKININKKNKIAKFGVANPVSGIATILIDFIGTNNDQMYGFYRSSYKSGSGKEEYILSSQFEAADARAAFPCFDEPEFKSTFEVSMEVPKEMLAISNMPIKSERVSGDRKTVKFFTTPKMSSYLLFLGVGKFEKLSSTLGKLKVNAYATPGKKDLCQLSLDYAKRFILFYEKYFGIKYPLPKVDLIAIPDFAAGAMENWGAITFRETAMLGDAKSSSTSVKQQIAETVAHELAHQWFGDLVTMKWWNDLWLNESFATFMSFKAMNAVFPEWQSNIQYFDEVISTAFSADSIIHTHPISVNVSTPEEINEIFDEISYEKGGTFLHMLEDFATPKVFREGLHNYLKAHSYSNATKYDLWDAIYKEARKSSSPNSKQIKSFADKWLGNEGYPIIIQQTSAPNVKISQKRFLVSKPLAKIKDKQTWVMSLKYLSKGKVLTEIMDKPTASIKADPQSFFKLNYGQDYLYRVMYKDENLELLGKAIQDGNLSGLDAWGIENDLFSLARSSNIKAVKYIDFVNKYCMDVDYPANASVLSHIEWLDFMLQGTSIHDQVQQLGVKFAGKIIKNLGWSKRKGESNIESIVRSHAIRLSGQFGDKGVVAKATKILDSYLKGKTKIDPDFKTPIFVVCASNSGKQLFDKFFDMYKKESKPEEKRRFLQTLGYFRGKGEIKRALQICISSEVRLQDSFVIPTILSENPDAYKALESWTYSNWKLLMEKYSIGTHMLGRFIENLSMGNTEEQYSTIKSFFSKKQNYRGDIKITLQKTLERVSANAIFKKKNSE
jgi:aminopeptidase N